MKTYFHQNYCAHCGKKHDSAEGVCPSCGTRSADFDELKSWRVTVPLGWGEELALFLTGSIGLTVFSIILQYLILAIAKNAYVVEGLSGNALSNALKVFAGGVAYQAYLTLGAYLALFLTLLVVLGRGLYKLTDRFKKKETYLGLLIGLGMMVLIAVYSRLTATGNNANENAVESVVGFAPVASIFIVGIVGPFCEEVTYRVGLYNFLKRWNWIAALVITSVLFAAIHFDWSNASSATEWINFPIYLAMGFILTFTYEKFGFGASFLAHFTNNFIGVILEVIALTLIK